MLVWVLSCTRFCACTCHHDCDHGSHLQGGSAGIGAEQQDAHTHATPTDSFLQGESARLGAEQRAAREDADSAKKALQV